MHHAHCRWNGVIITAMPHCIQTLSSMPRGLTILSILHTFPAYTIIFVANSKQIHLFACKGGLIQMREGRSAIKKSAAVSGAFRSVHWDLVFQAFSNLTETAPPTFPTSRFSCDSRECDGTNSVPA